MKSKPVLCAAGVALAALVGLAACTSPLGPQLATLAPEATNSVATPAPSPTSWAAPTPSPGTLRAVAPMATPPGDSLAASERLRLAALQRENGSYEAAGAALRALVESPEGPAEVRREALWRLIDCDLEAGAYASAAASAQRYTAAYPDSPEAATAWFWLGEALAALRDGPGAAAAYRTYLERNPLLGSYVQARIGDALAKAGDHAGAVVAYRAGADAETSIPNQVGILESLAASFRALGRYDEAVAAYGEILQVARIPDYRARIMHEAGAALRDAGRTADAAARWNELVAAYPESASAGEDLPLLDQWGLASADALTRARVDHAAGRDEAALATLRRYLQSDPAGHAGSAHYYAALCYRSLGRHRDSVRELDLLIETHPQDALVPEAWYQKGESLALQGAVDAAATTFQGLAARYPQHARSAPALLRVAQVYEDAGRSWDASAAYRRAVTTYPGAGYAPEARFRAGLVHYRNRAVQAAAQAWAEFLPQEKDPAMRARLLLWLGKVAMQLKDGKGAKEWWTQAVAADPEGFWGLRGRDLLAGRRFAGQALPGAFDPGRYAPRGSQAEAEAWLLGWAGAVPDGRPVSQLPASLAGLDSLRRGVELWRLGDTATATDELRQAVAAAGDDPRSLYALALHCCDRGIYLFSTSIAERVLKAAPARARQNAPRFLEELAYPTYYVGLVLKEAQLTNTDPLLFLALVRQESYFDRRATSRSDARGLAQVIPSTGSYIAGRLGDGAFTPERLWRPEVSVRYGVWYLASALKMFDDDAVMALVAYNAGPGNAGRWGKLAEGDDDLFFETVGSAEPRAYVRKIYEHRAQYERLYR